VLYVAFAKLGLALGIRAHQVTAVWPPTGFAIAALLLLGKRNAAGVFLGALVANATSGEPFWTAAGIAAGNTLEALFAASLLQHLEFDSRIARVRDVLLLVGAAIVSPIISATIGVASLIAGAVQPAAAAPALWALWWTGDALGAVIVAPLLLVWNSSTPARRRRMADAEGVIGTALIMVLSATVFLGWLHVPTTEYVVFPCVIWAALRFGPRGSALIAVITNAIAVFGTHLGRGPFAGTGPEAGLVALQLFTSVVAATGLVLGAVSEQNREAQERKDEFLAMLGHELRNPLAPIVNAAELLDGRNPAVETIRRQAAHLARLVGDLLDVSRITRGVIHVERRRVLLEDVVAPAIETWRHLAAQKEVQLSVSLTAERVWLDADAARFTQVVANLLHNAIKFTPPGGEVRITAAISHGVLLLEVSDTGEGIAPDLQAHVFELFVQGPPPIDRPRGGLGLGLTLVQRLVELHGGTVSVTSEGAGKGTTFTVRVPIAAAAAVSTSSAKELRPAIPTAAKRVLVVEDHSDARTMLTLLIEREGHLVRAAADGHEALLVAKEFRPEVVLLDVGLPGIDGYAVARELRARPETARASVIALTGYGTLEDPSLFDQHLVKPVEPEVLLPLLSAGER